MEIRIGEVTEAREHAEKGVAMGKREKAGIGAAAAAAFLGLAVLTGCGADPARDQYRLDGISQLEQGDYESAIQSFDQAIAHSDGRVGEFELDVLKYRAEAEYKAEDYPAAVHTYDVLLEAGGKDADLYYLRSISQAALGETEAAQADFDAAAAMNGGQDSPVMEDALTALGRAYQADGDWEKAKSVFDRALSSETATAGLYNSLGTALLEGGQAEEAADYFDRGLALAQPGSEEYGVILRNKGAALERAGKFSQALEVFRQYQASGISDPEVEREIRFLETR